MDGSYQLLAGRYVRRQARQLIGQLDGVRKADDVEFVHRARVASRRLRAALGIFRDCFGRKKVKRWRKGVRRLTQALGPARDKDVQIAFVRKVLASLEDATHRPGIARLLLRLEQGRRALQPKAVEAVDRFEAGGVAEEMHAAAKRILSELKRRELSCASRFAACRAEKHVVKHLNEFLDYEHCLATPEDIDQHHAMRIAAKRLRYTMEICQPVYEGGLGEFIQAVKDVQSLLGDIHDCDVWVEELEGFAEEERERTVAYFGHARPFGRLKIGLDYLRQERGRHRREGFAQLAHLWREFNQDGLWERLVRTVQWPLGPPADSEPSAGAAAHETGDKPKTSPSRGQKNPPPADGNGQTIPAAEQPVGKAGADGRKGNRQQPLSGVGGPGKSGS